MTEKKEHKQGALDLNEVQIVAHYLAPDYVVEAAKVYGSGDPVVGASRAYREVRDSVRAYLRSIRGSRGSDVKLGLMLRHLGWIPWGFDHVVPVEDERCEFYTNLFPNGETISGGVEVDTGDADYKTVFRAVMRIASNILYHDEINRCVLRGRVWQRTDQKVMVHMKTRERLISSVYDAQRWTDEQLEFRMKKALKAAVKAEKHEPLLTEIGKQLLEAWLSEGFITSPAGFMISSAPTCPMGWAALVPTNGISLALCVNRVKDGKCFIGLTPDHRVLDGDHCGLIYETLEREVANECISNRRD